MALRQVGHGPQLTAIIAAWQNGVLSRDSMFDLFRRGEILPDGQTNEKKERLVGKAGAVGQTPKLVGCRSSYKLTIQNLRLYLRSLKREA